MQSPFKGKHHTEESKKKLRDANIGKQVSEETRKKLSNAHKGRIHTEESRMKNSESKKGRVFTDIWRKRLSDSAKKRVITDEYRKKMSEVKLGVKLKPHTDESKKKMSEARKKYYRENKDSDAIKEWKRKIALTSTGRIKTEETKRKISEKRIKYMQDNPGPYTNTKPELEVKKILEDNNINYEHQKYVGNKLFDFYLPDYNLLIEVDGVFYHGKGIKDEDLKYDIQKGIRINDKFKDKLAKDRGFKLLRIWQDETNILDVIIKNKSLN